jgi:hypothetical protein
MSDSFYKWLAAALKGARLGPESTRPVDALLTARLPFPEIQSPAARVSVLQARRCRVSRLYRASLSLAQPRSHGAGPLFEYGLVNVT